MTLYGNESRVSVDVSGGGIAGISGGGTDKLVIFARGDPSTADRSVNDPVDVTGPSSLDSLFGADTPIVEYIRQAGEAGISYEQMYGVMPDVLTETDEDVTAGGDESSHTSGSEIANAPIVEDTSLITFEDDTPTELTVEFRYETNKDETNTDFTSLTPPADTVYINPLTGEWVADTADNYSITYDYLDWQSAFDAADGVIGEQEVGEWFIGVDSASVTETAVSTVEPLRENQWKMVRVLGLAEANETSDNDTAHINETDYSDNIDDEAAFVFGPSRLSGDTLTAGGAIAGVAAGNDLDDPIIGEVLSNVGELDQTLTVPQQEALETEQLIPLSNRDDPTIEGNLATATAKDWLRTFFSVRVADRLVLVARAVAKASRGELNSDTTETTVEQQLSDEIVDLIDQNILQPNGAETNWFVNATQDATDPRQLNVEFGFTPTGVVDTVKVDTTINF